MIICFEGTPGSGKSFEAVKKILDNLKLGRTVYTNIDGLDLDVQREHIKLYTGLDDYELNTKLISLSRDQVHKFWEVCKNGSLIVIDEVQNYFSNRDWQSAENKACASWASTHRHHGFDVVLISQSYERIDTAVRALIEWSYRFRKLNMFGSLFQSGYMCYAYSGEPQGKPLSQSVRKYDSRIFACYKSYVSSDTKELGIMTHANVLKHPVFFAIPLALLAFAWFGSKSSFVKGDLFGANARLNKPKPVQTSIVSAPVNIVNNPVAAINPVFPSIMPAASNPQVRPQEKTPAVKVRQDHDHTTPGNSNIITGLATAGDTVLCTIQDRGVIELTGYKFNDGAICRDDKCYRIGDSLPYQI